jgi:hypothetical protein
VVCFLRDKISIYTASAEVKEWVELYLHSPNTPSWSDAQLGGAQGQLYLYFLYLLTGSRNNTAA